MHSIGHTDVLIVGGGVIGLSLAYELAQTDRSVRVLERVETGKEASWAGAGTLPPGSWFSDHPAMDALAAMSHQLNAAWSQQLAEETGIDDELDPCGALYAVTPSTAEVLRDKFIRWKEQGIDWQRLSSTELRQVDPALVGPACYFVPSEVHVRNPRRLAALKAACVRRGVLIDQHSSVSDFVVSDDTVRAAIVDGVEVMADAFCMCAGAWTGGILRRLGIDAPTKPVRGQMLLMRTPERCLSHIYHQDGKYMVPRRDGHVLVGSTVEDCGFDKSTTPQELNQLRAFAEAAAPCLRNATIERGWAGLRPASSDGLPMIGRLPSLANAWVASGHFRSGLQFAPATAVIVRQMMDAEPPCVDAGDFAPGRFAAVDA